MANLDLVSIDPLRLSALSFIINLCLMSTEGGFRSVLCAPSLSEMFSRDDTDNNEPQGSCVSAHVEGLSMAGGPLVDPCPVRSDGCCLRCVTGGLHVCSLLQRCGPLQGMSV